MGKFSHERKMTFKFLKDFMRASNPLTLPIENSRLFAAIVLKLILSKSSGFTLI